MHLNRCAHTEENYKNIWVLENSVLGIARTSTFRDRNITSTISQLLKAWLRIPLVHICCPSVIYIEKLSNIFTVSFCDFWFTRYALQRELQLHFYICIYNTSMCVCVYDWSCALNIAVWNFLLPEIVKILDKHLGCVFKFDKQIIRTVYNSAYDICWDKRSVLFQWHCVSQRCIWAESSGKKRKLISVFNWRKKVTVSSNLSFHQKWM